MMMMLIGGRIHCPACNQQMTITHKAHHVAVEATHTNSGCPFGGQLFRVHPNTGYAQRAA
jgi:hypothetical protein